MTNRFGHIQELVFLRGQLRKFPNQTDRLVKESIILSLPRQYRQVYDWIAARQPITSAMVAEAFGINQNHASTLLKELHEFGLLKREQKIDGNGRTFWYAQVE